MVRHSLRRPNKELDRTAHSCRPARPTVSAAGQFQRRPTYRAPKRMRDLGDVVSTFLEGLLARGTWRTLVGTVLGGLGAVAAYLIAAGDSWRVVYALAVLCVGIVLGFISEPKGAPVEEY
jgi:hypothetical protein